MVLPALEELLRETVNNESQGLEPMDTHAIAELLQTPSPGSEYGATLASASSRTLLMRVLGVDRLHAMRERSI